jgi:hypothetical protein
MELPTQPVKTKGNSHAKGWSGGTVQAEAIPPGEMRELLDSALRSHVPHAVLEQVEVEEREAKSTLAGMIDNLSARDPSKKR